MGREDNNRGRGGGPRRFKKGFRNRQDSKDDNEGPKGPRNDRKRGGDKRGKGDKRRHERKQKPDEIDLNRQLKDYWSHLKDPTKTDEEKRQITSKKFNDEMDDYWKKQVKDEPAPPAS